MRKFDLNSLKFCVVDSGGNFYQATETKEEADNIIRRGLYRSGYEKIQPTFAGLPEHCRVVPFILDKESRPVSNSVAFVKVRRNDRWVKATLLDVDAQGVIARYKGQPKYYSWDECRKFNVENVVVGNLLAC